VQTISSIKVIYSVIVQAMKVLNRATSLSETLYAEAQRLISTVSVSYLRNSNVTCGRARGIVTHHFSL